MTRIHQVYFLQRADGLIKIGTSTDFQSRLAGLSKSHGMLGIVRLINGDRRLERRLHAKFKRFHEYGEWFRPERGALVDLIMALPDGDELPASATDARQQWDAGEQRLADEAAHTIEAILEVRRQRTGLKTEKAIAAIAADYGLPPSFLSHLRKRASTVSAYGFEAIKVAYRAELVEALRYYRERIEAVTADSSDDDELLAISDRIQWIRDELVRRKELRASRNAG